MKVQLLEVRTEVGALRQPDLVAVGGLITELTEL